MRKSSITLALLAVLCPVTWAQRPVAGITDPASEPIVQTVARTLPAVVNINTERLVVRSVQDPFESLYEQFYGRSYGRRRVAQRVRSLGSGFFVHPDGYILTNEHVVERAEGLKIKVTMANGKTYDAKYIVGDADRDLALIKVEDSDKFPFVDTAKLSPNYIGQTCIAIGNPIGYQSSVSAGILSAKNRSVGSMSGLLQTDAAINPGNSGGPLVDISGKLVGVNSMKISYTGSGDVPAENISFAIPADIATDWAQTAIAIARGERAAPPAAEPVQVLEKRLGIKLADLDTDAADKLGFWMIDGVVIASVETGGPADKAGIKPGMVLRAVGPYGTPELSAMPKEIGKIREGTSLILSVARSVRQGRVIYQQNLQVQVVAR
jgi:S1-C subfamily serine protease